MGKYKQILVATDFSPVSEVAAKEAVEFAERYGSELIFLYIIEHFPQHLPHYRIAHEDMDPEHFIIDRAEKDLAALCARLGKPDASQEVRLTTHSAKAEILKAAKELDVELIFVGARGHNLLDILSGSTATGVVRGAPCSVFVVQESGSSK